MTPTTVYLRRQYGGVSLALYVRTTIGEDDYAIPFTGKVRCSRKVHERANCGHKIHNKEQYYDVRSSSLPSRALRYCLHCFRMAEGAQWDVNDELAEHEEIMDDISDD